MDMEFITSLKSSARQIIELTDRFGDRLQTWNQQQSAPVGGFTDRAGFMVYDAIELTADVVVSEDGTEHLLRARLALSPDDAPDSLFTIITLDFTAEPTRVKEAIAKSSGLTAADLNALLQDSATLPKLIHVSLESGKDATGAAVGKRYEYTASEITNLSESDQAEFIAALNGAYQMISAKI